jgi:hypothetical protein
MTDYKALCARMADELDYYRQLLMDDRRETHALATEARAALAQPEPVVPTDEELYDLWDQEACYFNLYEEARDFARAVLARWGCPQPEPETDDSLTNYPKVTRVEVITSKGREFVRHECAHVQFSLQDDGRTIKVFLSSND